MRSTQKRSKLQRREEMLCEIASEETLILAPGSPYSRAAEALEAMRRIRDGTYGICADCGGRIPEARLQAKPEATCCVKCQSERERRSVA